MADWMIGPKLYSCYKCGNMIYRHDDIISKIFQASHGRAFLFTHVHNVVDCPEEDRQLIAGLHTVTDVYCSDCGELLGWRYIEAYEQLQKYKEGQIVLERLKIAKERW